jgi:hypothetical protein
MGILGTILNGIDAVSNAWKDVNAKVKKVAIISFVIITLAVGIWFVSSFKYTLNIPFLLILAGAISSTVISVFKKLLINVAVKTVKKDGISIGIATGLAHIFGGDAKQVAIESVKGAVIPRFIIAFVGLIVSIVISHIIFLNSMPFPPPVTVFIIATLLETVFLSGISNFIVSIILTVVASLIIRYTHLSPFALIPTLFLISSISGLTVLMFTKGMNDIGVGIIFIILSGIITLIMLKFMILTLPLLIIVLFSCCIASIIITIVNFISGSYLITS